MPSDILFAPVLTSILVVRHAEVHNPKDIVYGRLPRFGLSARGRNQAEELGKFLAARNAATIYTSPLLRARQTANIIAYESPAAQIHATQALLEVKTSYQGSPNSILKPGFSFYEPLKDPKDETMQQVFDRILRFLRSIVRHHAGETVVAVTHADPIAIMRVGLDRLPFTAANLHSTVYPERASVTQITLDPGQPLGLTYFDVAGHVQTPSPAPGSP